MMECECGAYKGDGPVCQRCDTWIDTQARGEDELRKLAKERDEAVVVMLKTLRFTVDQVHPWPIPSGESLAQPSPLKAVPSVANGDVILSGDATILPFKATDSTVQEGHA